MNYRIMKGDVLEGLRELPDESVHCVVTSPPYWGLRDYGVAGQIGLEKTPEEFIAKLVEVFREVRRVLRSDGTCWVNMGDAYASHPGQRNNTTHADTVGWKQASNRGSRGTPSRSPKGIKPKDLIGQPWMLAFALRADGWYLRQDIIWAKPNPMPESVTDRCTKAHEYLFLLTKSSRYFYDAEAIKEQVTGGAHARGNGVNPKAEGTNSRFNVSRDHGHATRPKQNSSYSAAINELVGTRNKRSVWEIATEPFPEAHFATFPTELARPCILAGTSEKGCCEICGAPWLRIVDQEDTGIKQQMADGWDTGSGVHGSMHRDGRQAGEVGKPVMMKRPTGWEPSCMCSPLVTPCTVLDPFNGSGTTGIVALANRCNYIGIELNPEYVAMTERRLEQATSQGVLL